MILTLTLTDLWIWHRCTWPRRWSASSHSDCTPVCFSVPPPAPDNSRLHSQLTYSSVNKAKLWFQLRWARNYVNCASIDVEPLSNEFDDKEVINLLLLVISSFHYYEQLVHGSNHIAVALLFTTRFLIGQNNRSQKFEKLVLSPDGTTFITVNSHIFCLFNQGIM